MCLECICVGQSATLWSCFSPSTYTWILGIKLRSPGFRQACLCPLCLLASPSSFCVQDGEVKVILLVALLVRLPLDLNSLEDLI